MSSSDPSSLAWLWCVEYLARFHQLPILTLLDLIQRLPDLSYDDWGNNLKEMVALRLLEELFGHSNRNQVFQESRIRFDFSETCANVLQGILEEISPHGHAGHDVLLKWDVQQFIMHKRASMKKCTLKKLKDLTFGNSPTVKGNHPASATFNVNEHFVDDEGNGINQGEVKGRICERNVLPDKRSSKKPVSNENIVQNQGEAEGRIYEQNPLSGSNKSSDKPVCAVNNVGDINSDSDTDKFKNSHDFTRREKGKQRCAVPTKKTRRAAIRWTTEEKEFLTKEVKKFLTDGSGQFPWKRILGSGAHVFQNGRTPVDLKDKWKDLCKPRKCKPQLDDDDVSGELHEPNTRHDQVEWMICPDCKCTEW